ncbi:unnamed protein product [Cylicocyclus nassatus]|uniref:SSD domain-containing protein n=1 Tax=Cylicocyclus nassatus TaxID=53992 RepID=A0AA36H9A5_CYLNA|nr:unnamed protein product [Cylicocyclus nassatus]
MYIVTLSTTRLANIWVKKFTVMRPLERLFYTYGDFLARHPWPFIIVPTLLTIISSYGMVFFHSQDDIWDIYAPLDGLSRVEEKALLPFEYASASHHYRMQVLVTKKDGGNVLTMDALDEMLEVQKYVTENITFSNGLKNFEYYDICGVYCGDSNSGVIAFLQTALASEGLSSMKLTFPIAQALQKRIFLGYSLGNLTYSKQRPGEVEKAGLLILHYMVDTSLPNGRVLAEDFETKLNKIFASLTASSKELKYSTLSRTREMKEQRDITITALPFLFVTVGILVLFMLVTNIEFPLYRSQYMESIVGVISPSMALWTSGGFLFWIGFPFSNILTVVPFLVVVIGIDDAFLVLAGWRQSTKGAPLEQRIAESVAISGASVTVTSVTDVLCFAIGLFSNMPVIRLFCLFTSLALFVDYVYQMTFFTAVMSFIVRRQIKLDRKAIESKVAPEIKVLPMDKTKDKLGETAIFTVMMPAFTPPPVRKPTKGKLEIFVEILHTKTAKILVMATFFAHIGISAYLASSVSTDFDMENLYLEGSPLTEVSRKMQDFVLREAFVVNFAVQPMPDIQNATIREKFEEMVDRLEHIPKYGGGPDNTILWIRDYSSAVAFWGEEEDFWDPKTLLKNYRDYGMEDRFVISKRLKDGSEVIDGFYFIIAYKNMSTFTDVKKMMDQRRAIIDSYPFHVLSHHPFEKVPTESAASVPKNFLQTALSAVILMSILVLLFVMNWEAIISVIISILSICLGIVAYLNLWHVNLDAVSLISILMSVGFSVDYSAHVCYHYFAHAQEESKDNKSELGSVESGSSSTSSESISSSLSKSIREHSVKRLVATLNGVGWPVVQSGLSTVIGMFPLMFVRAYVVAVFWKTVLLVGFLGMFHALLLLPVIFILTEDLKRFFRFR